MTGLVSLTICIPSMARLHPSNSLPKVLGVLRDASILHTQCRMGLEVHEAEQAWSALTVLERIVKLELPLHTIEFTRAFFPVETLIHAAQICGLESLSLHATQVSSFSRPSNAAATIMHDPRQELPSIPTLTSLTAPADSESSPGLDTLLHTTANMLTQLDLSSSNGGSGLTLRERDFPRLARLSLHEELLLEAIGAHMPALQEVILPTLMRAESCNAIQEVLRSSWPGVRDVRVSQVVVGDVSEALTRLGQAHASVRVTIKTLAVREPSRLTPAALAISEHLTNIGPPIAEEWPLGFDQCQYPRLKSIVLKVKEGCNHDEFIASLDAPNLEGPPSITLIGKRKGKSGKR